ncbi:DUF4350 domain-containing protein [Aureitalea marina]|uniref:DUF4350 domain-containing protein n=1 Tax=Aureitalea marina TaxID=930804 RepID=A0A2S7KPU9_9FLAO|nr:DUF4350 domain-containing protein [Aureitalea marina]PQB04652.1 hypothetical protein BST85_06895 [Aureitalea marina]
MNRTQKIGWSILILATAGLIFLEATKPVPVSWFPSYYEDSTIPLGTKVLFELMDNEPSTQLVNFQEPPFQVLTDSSINGSYFFLNDYINIEETEGDKLLDWVASGNQVFVAAKSPGGYLLDSLGLEIETAFLTNRLVTEPVLELVNPALTEAEPRYIQRDLTVNYFGQVDTATHRVLGQVQLMKDSLSDLDYRPNFIEVPHGDGRLLFHLQPEVFSNYFLLEEDNVEFTAKVLSYLEPKATWFWDGYYKNGKPVNISPLRQLLDTRSLKWAYYILLFGILIYVLFQGKRRQRPIPIVQPPANKTFEFTQTIAGVYWDKKAFGAIANKQILLFLEFIRMRFRIPTENRDRYFMRQLSERSGNSLEDTENLFTFIGQVETSQQLSQQDLIQLNKRITQFKSTTDGNS